MREKFFDSACGKGEGGFGDKTSTSFGLGAVVAVPADDGGGLDFTNCGRFDNGGTPLGLCFFGLVRCSDMARQTALPLRDEIAVGAFEFQSVNSASGDLPLRFCCALGIALAVALTVAVGQSAVRSKCACSRKDRIAVRTLVLVGFAQISPPWSVKKSSIMLACVRGHKRSAVLEMAVASSVAAQPSPSVSSNSIFHAWSLVVISPSTNRLMSWHIERFTVATLRAHTGARFRRRCVRTRA